jgi:hypothetical protein
MGALTVGANVVRAIPVKHPLLAQRTIEIALADGIDIFKTSITWDS